MRQSVRAIILNQNKLAVMHRNKFGKKYYTLIGGGVDLGETKEQAVTREIMEETGMAVGNPRLVIIEDHDKFYGPQYIYLCDYISGEPRLSPDCPEYKINGMGQNLYEPQWLSLDQLAKVTFMSPQLQELLVQYIPKGFPGEPLMLN